jgi:hypothetical protein
MSVLKVTVKETTTKGQTSLQGSYQLTGSSVTKLQTKDGSTQFSTRATLNQVARKVAAALGWTLEYQEPALKAAAKKSLKPVASANKAAAPKATKTSKPVSKKTATKTQSKTLVSTTDVAANKNGCSPASTCTAPKS